MSYSKANGTHRQAKGDPHKLSDGPMDTTGLLMFEKVRCKIDYYLSDRTNSMLIGNGRLPGVPLPRTLRDTACQVVDVVEDADAAAPRQRLRCPMTVCIIITIRELPFGSV